MERNIPSLDILIDVVREAAGLMRTDTFEVSCKEGYSNIVTSSDVAVQNFLCARLAALLPGSGFLCEEEDMWDTSHEYTWIIDPIDGTANYSRGIAQCAVCVALKHDADIELGVVCLPMTGELFSAERGRGAYLNGHRISVSGRPFADSVMCTALPVYHKEYAGLCSDIIRETFSKCNDIRRKTVTCHNTAWARKSKRFTIQICDNATGLGDYQRGCGKIPRTKQILEI